MIFKNKYFFKILIISSIISLYFLGYFLRENSSGGGLEFFEMEWTIIQSLKKDFLFTIKNYGQFNDYTMPFAYLISAFLNPFSDNIVNFQLSNTIGFQRPCHLMHVFYQQNK